MMKLREIIFFLLLKVSKAHLVFGILKKKPTDTNRRIQLLQRQTIKMESLNGKMIALQSRHNC